MKKLMSLLVVVAVVAVLIGNVGVVSGGVSVTNPDQLMEAGATNRQYFKNDYGDNLMERIGGVDTVIDKGLGEYHTFFGKNVPGGKLLGGYVTTDNENTQYPGYEGWCEGYVYRSTFPEGSEPNYALTIYDDDGGQFGLFYSDGRIVFDENIVTWESGVESLASGDIDYEGVLHGIVEGGLVFGATTGDLKFGHTVLVPPPFVREGPFDVNDLLDFAYYWKSSCDYDNGSCGGLDLNGSGFVNLADFSLLAAEWMSVSVKMRLAPIDTRIKSLVIRNTVIGEESANITTGILE